MSHTIYDLPKTRTEALELGIPFYFTGKVCKQGHLSKRRVRGHCFECEEERRKTPDQVYTRRQTILAWHKANPYSKYKLSVDDVAALRKSQGDQCAICSTKFGDTRITRPNIDHCHTTGKVRGLLCQFCNCSLGMMQDDPDRLRKAAAYLSGS